MPRPISGREITSDNIQWAYTDAVKKGDKETVVKILAESESCLYPFHKNESIVEASRKGHAPVVIAVLKHVGNQSYHEHIQQAMVASLENNRLDILQILVQHVIDHNYTLCDRNLGYNVFVPLFQAAMKMGNQQIDSLPFNSEEWNFAKYLGQGSTTLALPIYMRREAEFQVSSVLWAADGHHADMAYSFLMNRSSKSFSTQELDEVQKAFRGKGPDYLAQALRLDIEAPDKSAVLDLWQASKEHHADIVDLLSSHMTGKKIDRVLRRQKELFGKQVLSDELTDRVIALIKPEGMPQDQYIAQFGSRDTMMKLVKLSVDAIVIDELDRLSEQRAGSSYWVAPPELEKINQEETTIADLEPRLLGRVFSSPEARKAMAPVSKSFTAAHRKQEVQVGRTYAKQVVAAIREDALSLNKSTWDGRITITDAHHKAFLKLENQLAIAMRNHSGVHRLMDDTRQFHQFINAMAKDLRGARTHRGYGQSRREIDVFEITTRIDNEEFNLRTTLLQIHLPSTNNLRRLVDSNVEKILYPDASKAACAAMRRQDGWASRASVSSFQVGA